MKDKEKLLKEIKNRFESSQAVCEIVINIFNLVANKTRFRILCMLAEGDFCVTEIVETINLGKVSHVSQQLKLLTLSGILQKERNKKQVIYHLKDKKIKKLIKFLQDNYLIKGV